jgi:hypothetical protein
MVSIARPVFETGPKDNVAMVDAYNAATPEVRNDLTSKLSSFGNSLTETFGAAGRAFGKIGSGITNGDINVDDAARRIKSALGGSRGDIANLATSVQNGIFSELTGTVPGTNYVKGATDLYDSVQVISGNANYIINSDQKSAQSILGFVSSITGNSIFKTLDLGAEAALIGGLVGTVSSWGVPALVDEMMAGRDDQFKYSVYSRNSDSILTSNPTPAMMDYYVTQGMAAALTAQRPDFGANYLQQYTFPLNTTPDQYATLHAQLVKIMDALVPNWLQTPRGSTTSVVGDTTVVTPRMVTNLSVIERASADAKVLLLSQPSTQAAALCAPNFPKVDLIQLSKKLYPLIGIVGSN